MHFSFYHVSKEDKATSKSKKKKTPNAGTLMLLRLTSTRSGSFLFILSRVSSTSVELGSSSGTGLYWVHWMTPAPQMFTGRREHNLTITLVVFLGGKSISATASKVSDRERTNIQPTWRHFTCLRFNVFLFCNLRDSLNYEIYLRTLLLV